MFLIPCGWLEEIKDGSLKCWALRWNLAGTETSVQNRLGMRSRSLLLSELGAASGTYGAT